MDKLLAKDVAKGKITSEEAKEARDRVVAVGEDVGVKGLRDVDMVIEVRLIYGGVPHIFHAVYDVDGCDRLYRNPSR